MYKIEQTISTSKIVRIKILNFLEDFNILYYLFFIIAIETIDVTRTNKAISKLFDKPVFGVTSFWVSGFTSGAGSGFTSGVGSDSLISSVRVFPSMSKSATSLLLYKTLLFWSVTTTPLPSTNILFVVFSVLDT